MTTHKPLPTQLIDECVRYEPETGKIYWKKCGLRRIPVGAEAGSLADDGYIRISFGSERFRAHRIAWYLHYGEDPGELEIDHKNRVKSDNRITNLRLVNRQQNQWNLGRKGFCLHKGTGKWQARIRHGGKRLNLGLHDCPALARFAYLYAKSKLHRVHS